MNNIKTVNNVICICGSTVCIYAKYGGNMKVLVLVLNYFQNKSTGTAVLNQNLVPILVLILHKFASSGT